MIELFIFCLRNSSKLVFSRKEELLKANQECLRAPKVNKRHPLNPKWIRGTPLNSIVNPFPSNSSISFKILSPILPFLPIFYSERDHNSNMLSSRMMTLRSMRLWDAINSSWVSFPVLLKWKVVERETLVFVGLEKGIFFFFFGWEYEIEMRSSKSHVSILLCPHPTHRVPTPTPFPLHANKNHQTNYYCLTINQRMAWFLFGN